MRTASRLVTVIAVAALTAIAGGGWGSMHASPAYAPTTPVLLAGPALSGTVVVATEALRGGVPVPRGATALGPPATAITSRGLHRWENAYDLHGTTGDAALAMLRDWLTRQGFEVRGGPHDVFGARRSDRYEIVVATVEARGSGSSAATVLVLGIGSRPS